MKKRTAVLVLAIVLSFSLFGYGNNADQKQEEPQEETEQEEAQQEEIQEDIETENFLFLKEVGKVEYLLGEFEWEESTIEFTTQYETDVYDMEGRKVGYIKSNVPVTITEHGINSGWYRFKNPENGTDYEYLCVLRDDVEAQVQNETENLEEQAETPILSDEYIEEQKMYDEAMSLIDENKTYTVEEFHQLMKDICEIVGTEYDSNIMENPQGMPGERTLNLKGKKLKQFFEEEQFIWWLMMGPTGSNKMDVYIYIEDGIDTSEDFEVLVFSRYHKE